MNLVDRLDIVLWGTGKITKRCLDKGYFSKHNIIGIIDNNKKRDLFYDIPVYESENATNIINECDYLVVTNSYFDEILEQCIELKISLSKIAIIKNVKGIFISKCFDNLKKISKELHEEMQVEECRLLSTNLSDRIDKDRLLGKGKYTKKTSYTDYMSDYFRYRTFEFAAKEIKENHIDGAIAELGVFRGEFASLMNETFRKRKLFLFDTFESFDKIEFEKERDAGNCSESFRESHANTSEELVIRNLPYLDNCVICKGLFPESVTPEVEAEKYAFVSLDVDFEESTYQGLKFFYPRLSENGYIFIHDYITHWLPGVKKAVERYEHENGMKLKKIPIADRGGTLIITK